MPDDSIYREFFEISLDMLCIAGTDGFFHTLNPAWEQVLGFSNEELKSKPFIEFVHEDDREATMAEASRLGAGGWDTVSFVNRYLTASGEYKWLLWSARLSSNKMFLLSIARDITEIKQNEIRLRAASEAAHAANKSKSEFLANMSHELRTPLNAIIGFSRILKKNKSGALDDIQLMYLDRISGNGVHLLDLINEILDLSKIEAGQLSIEMCDIEIHEVIQEVLSAVKAQPAAAALRVGVRCPAQPPTVRADRQRLKQILLNLVSNSVKFTHGGGVVLEVVCDDTRVLRLDVVDTGIGVAADVLPTLFTPFTQADASTSREYGGTGLGLSISRSLAEAMGLRLLSASKEGVGSTFSIVFESDAEPPSHIEPSWSDCVEVEDIDEPAQTLAELTADPIPRRPSVLLVDDETDSRALIERLLHDRNYQVTSTDNADDAESIAATLMPDIILLDLMMPGRSGASLLESLKENPRTRDIPVVVVSIVAADHTAAVGQAMAVLSKPIDPALFAQTVEAALRNTPAPCVLVVDDDSDVRSLLNEALTEMGADVVEAQNGARALIALNNVRPDLILLDLMMPKMDGFSFLAAIRSDERYRQTPVVVLTAKELTSMDHQRLGDAQLVLAKNVDIETSLLEALHVAGMTPVGRTA